MQGQTLKLPLRQAGKRRASGETAKESGHHPSLGLSCPNYHANGRWGLSCGPVVKNLPGLGGPLIPWSSQARAPQLLSPHTLEPGSAQGKSRQPDGGPCRQSPRTATKSQCNLKETNKCVKIVPETSTCSFEHEGATVTRWMTKSQPIEVVKQNSRETQEKDQSCRLAAAHMPPQPPRLPRHPPSSAGPDRSLSPSWPAGPRCLPKEPCSLLKTLLCLFSLQSERWPGLSVLTNVSSAPSFLWFTPSQPQPRSPPPLSGMI